MALIDTFDFEDQDDGQPVTVSGDWSTSGGASTMTASTDAAAHGALGARFTGVTGFRRIDHPATDGAAVLDLYLTLRTISGITYFMSCPGGRGDARINADRTVTIRSGFTAADTSAIALGLNTTYRVAWQVLGLTQELRVYEGESDSPLFTLSGSLASTAGTPDVVAAGFTTAPPAGTIIDIDSLRVADDWLPPLAPPQRTIGYLGTTPIAAAYLGEVTIP